MLRITFCSLFLLVGHAHAADTKKIDFEREIRPILADHCWKCHGPDEQTRRGGLRLDARAFALAEADSGMHAIVPGKPDASELIARIEAEGESTQMPPRATKKPLSAEQKKLLRQWIAEGAEFRLHWAFVAPRRPARPSLRQANWSRGPLDEFVLQRLEQSGLKPSAETDRVTWLRRVSLDLIGVPPSVAEVEAFLADASPHAYERVVDRLLASPAFGERWGRVWLDLARYADSAGYAQDPPRTIWRYRDWVIRSLNAGMPFDQFTIEQLAGDLLPGNDEERILATAFHRNTMTNSEGGTDDEEFRSAAVVDRVNTTLSVWMGLTMACAQCHTHKYDPITQEEYFRVYAIFNNTEDADRGDESPLLTTLTAEEQAQKAKLQKEISLLVKVAKPSEAEKKQLDQLRKQHAAIQGVTTPILRELPRDRRRTTHIQLRGNFLDRGKVVTPGVPAIFPPIPGKDEPNRLTFARWLVSRDNPLTARVTVNRIWEEIFGLGIVETPEDFGVQGERPSHPELLDWLAVELQDLGWDTKRLLREIVLSATYRQSSQVSPEALQRDPNNRWLSRGPSYRLSAETIRDQALFVSGLLSQKMYGPSVQPPRPNLGLASAFGGSTDWTTSPGEDKFRRGLYTSWRRTTPYPSMTTFDAPSREVCTIRRIRTNTPLQALVTLNDPVYVEASQALARRIVQESGPSTRERIQRGFRLTVARMPTERELTRLIQLHDKVLADLRQTPEDALKLATDPLGPLPKHLAPVELGAWTVVGNVLLNLDEFLARR